MKCSLSLLVLLTVTSFFYLQITAFPQDNPHLNSARLYEHRNFRGPVLQVANIVGCFNFDKTSFNDKVSSIDTRGNCYFLYEDANCQGRWVRVSPHAEGDNDLADISFNDVASSIRSCNFNTNPYMNPN